MGFFKIMRQKIGFLKKPLLPSAILRSGLPMKKDGHDIMQKKRKSMIARIYERITHWFTVGKE